MPASQNQYLVWKIEGTGEYVNNWIMNAGNLNETEKIPASGNQYLEKG